ncbi:MAG: DUF4397 domain-containing protein [Gemmatimonadaceae bacterium]
MRRILLSLVAFAVAGCNTDITDCCSLGAHPSFRIVNAFTTPVTVTMDGKLVATIPAGFIDTIPAATGNHSLALRSTTLPANLSMPFTTTAGLNTMALTRSSNGDIISSQLDDTNSVVPAGATKLRIIHLAPNAGTLQVYRTQPDYQTPIAWQVPFDYQTDISSITAPFLQSTAGTWEVHIWQTPADASGWSNAPVKVLIPLSSGEKRTILMLDKAGGGVRVQIL